MSDLIIFEDDAQQVAVRLVMHLLAPAQPSHTPND